MFVSIGNTPRDYAWGSTSAIAGFRGVPASGAPEAELWLGAHAGSPARILDGSISGYDDLAGWIAADPETALGADLAARGARLPFLLKVLAAAEPLSLQAHPTPEQARAGFAREEAEGPELTAYDRNYKDEFHKPELIVAVSETFDALSGFRPLEEVAGILRVLREADAAAAEPQPAALELLEARLSSQHPLRDTVEWLLRDGRGGDTGEVAWVVERVTSLAASDLARASEYALSFETVAVLAEAYPGDPGIVISLLLNRVRLRRGESLYLAAGNIHAYLEGLGIELMAASDNVLRGGLTPKHIDVDELLEVLDFTPIAPPRLEPERLGAGVAVFRPDVPDFVLYRIEPASAPDAATTPIALDGPAIVLAEGASVEVRGVSGAASVARGEALYVTPDEARLTVTGDGVAWIATTGPA
ncbi:mannose-6-phosphate isomerase, class I [Agromyces salentinus]|uniref:mannose-6-phosphate isomerase n=1 Tax=Agromyces salentinus TaxID=269421 RepID=A0ABN2MYT5_9MICO|nr:mannose-6-phosphate isomerase, class I [Agromyces salentinus]